MLIFLIFIVCVMIMVLTTAVIIPASHEFGLDLIHYLSGYTLIAPAEKHMLERERNYYKDQCSEFIAEDHDFEVKYNELKDFMLNNIAEFNEENFSEMLRYQLSYKQCSGEEYLIAKEQQKIKKLAMKKSDQKSVLKELIEYAKAEYENSIRIAKQISGDYSSTIETDDGYGLDVCGECHPTQLFEDCDECTLCPEIKLELYKVDDQLQLTISIEKDDKITEVDLDAVLDKSEDFSMTYTFIRILRILLEQLNSELYKQIAKNRMEK